MFKKKQPKKAKLFPLVMTFAVIFTVSFHWGYVLEFVARGLSL